MPNKYTPKIMSIKNLKAVWGFYQSDLDYSQLYYKSQSQIQNISVKVGSFGLHSEIHVIHNPKISPFQKRTNFSEIQDIKVKFTE